MYPGVFLFFNVSRRLDLLACKVAPWDEDTQSSSGSSIPVEPRRGVLSDHYERVTVFERTINRYSVPTVCGVPQACTCIFLMGRGEPSSRSVFPAFTGLAMRASPVLKNPAPESWKILIPQVHHPWYSGPS
jgi:hypothetical protein